MIYVISPKSAYAAKRLKIEATLRLRSGPNGKQELRIMDLKDLIACNFKLTVHHGDTLYVRNPYLNGSPKYVQKIIALAEKFKAPGGRVVDTNIVKGDLGKGKWVDYQKLKKAGLPIPSTKKFSIFNFSAKGGPVSGGQFSKNSQYPIPNIQHPFIVKWNYGLKGKGVFLIRSASDFAKTIKLHPANEWLVQEFVRAKYEYKVITVGYKALPVVLRFRVQGAGFRVQGARLGVDFKNFSVIPTEALNGRVEESLNNRSLRDIFVSLRSGRDDKMRKVIQIAQRASKVLGRELSKIDILEDHKGQLYILEVNRFPGLKSFEELTGFNVFKEFVKYLKI